MLATYLQLRLRHSERGLSGRTAHPGSGQLRAPQLIDDPPATAVRAPDTSRSQLVVQCQSPGLIVVRQALRSAAQRRMHVLAQWPL